MHTRYKYSCMHAYTHTYVHAYTHTYMHAYTLDAYTHACSTYAYMHTHINMHMHMHIHPHANINLCMRHGCMYMLNTKIPTNIVLICSLDIIICSHLFSPFLCLSVCLSVCLSIRLSCCLSSCLSVCPFYTHISRKWEALSQLTHFPCLSLTHTLSCTLSHILLESVNNFESSSTQTQAHTHSHTHTQTPHTQIHTLLSHTFKSRTHTFEQQSLRESIFSRDSTCTHSNTHTHTRTHTRHTQATHTQIHKHYWSFIHT